MFPYLSLSESEGLCHRFPLAELMSATNNFDEELVIGRGGFGKVYRALIDDGTVALKRLDLKSKQGAKEFWTEIQMLSNLRHTHLVSLLGYCDERNEMILVYEFMENGTLADHLYKFETNGKGIYGHMSWEQRLNICIGAARGLDYLHTGDRDGIIHRDVKTTNILLDKDWTAKISDFGLCKLLSTSHSDTHVSTDVKGSFGYFDPHYFLTRWVTKKSDVYAFGVVMLEILCGRPAVDTRLDEKQHSLVLWAKEGINENKLHQLIDPILRDQISRKCLKVFVEVANKCLDSHPKGRPTMAEVVVRLKQALPSENAERGKVSKVFKMSIEFLAKSVQIKGKRSVDQKNKKKGKRSEIHDSYGKKSLLADGSTRSRLPWKNDTFPFRRVSVGRNMNFTSSVESGNINEAHLKEQILPTPNLRAFSLLELKTATEDFMQDRLLGQGSFGNVYKGWLYEKNASGLVVAVKKLDEDSTQGFYEWKTELDILGRFSHPNLVKLLGYCREKKQLLLVYEFVPKGSLDNHLFGGASAVQPLPWDIRLNILIGAARGLDFLHRSAVIYRDVKTSNMLLDESYNVKLSDFGLAKLGPSAAESHVSTRIVGTYGYVAPEYLATGHLSMSSDVYGYGVVLVEMLTGLRAMDSSRPIEQLSLVDWVKPYLLQERKLVNIMDSRLEGKFPSKAAFKIAQLALKCLESVPKNRPSMKEVVETLEHTTASNGKPMDTSHLQPPLPHRQK